MRVMSASPQLRSSRPTVDRSPAWNRCNGATSYHPIAYDFPVGLLNTEHASRCATERRFVNAAGIAVLFVTAHNGRLDQLETRLMTTGIVKFYNSTKGFGFITPDGGGGKDAFVHATALERAGISGLNEGDKVSYDLESGRDGKMSATNLKVLK